MREFKEEIGADIVVGDLKWVAEIFFTWGGRPCHQICLFYDVILKDEKQIPLNGSFIGEEQLEGRNFQIEFHWLPIETLDGIEVYPTNIMELLNRYQEGVQHFVSRQI